MKRNQKKYTKKNKGGATNKLVWDASVSAISKKLDDLDTRFDVISTKLGNLGNVNGPSRENDTRFGEAGYPEPTIGQNNPMIEQNNPMIGQNDPMIGQNNPMIGQNDPMIRNFVSNPSTSGKDYNGSTPITQNQYDEVDRLNIQIKGLMGDRKNKKKLEEQTSLKNALLAKYQKRVNYLENEQQARTLSQEEGDELTNLKANLNPNEPFGGGRKSRRYRKSKRSTRRKRTRKYKK